MKTRKPTKPVAASPRSVPLLIGNGSAAEPTHDEIARCAHAIWRAEGCPAGRDLEHWRRAEIQLRQAGPTAVVRF